MTLAIGCSPGSATRRRRSAVRRWRAANQLHKTGGVSSVARIYLLGPLRRPQASSNTYPNGLTPRQQRTALWRLCTTFDEGKSSMRRKRIKRRNAQAGKRRRAGTRPEAREIGGGARRNRGHGHLPLASSPRPRRRRRPMRDLNYDFKELCRRNRDGSFATQADREHVLDLIADQLHEWDVGDCVPRASNPSTSAKLVARWLAEQLAPGPSRTGWQCCAGRHRRSARTTSSNAPMPPTAFRIGSTSRTHRRPRSST